MEKLMAWNGCYGCEAFEVFVNYFGGKTIEEKKKFYEENGYICWIERR